MYTTHLMCDNLVGESHICIPCNQPIRIYVNIWNNIKSTANDSNLFDKLTRHGQIQVLPSSSSFLLYFALNTFTFTSGRVWNVWQTKFSHMSQDNAPLFKAAYLVPVRMLEEWQQQRSKKNDTFICHAALHNYGAADRSIHPCLLHFTATMHSEPWPTLFHSKNL